MYHHFRGKKELALAAIEENAADLRARAEADLIGPGSPGERITAYLRRERDALRGCPVGRLAQDPDVFADPVLRRPLDETFAWLRTRLAGLLADARDQGEASQSLDPQNTAAALIAILQGGYVLARAAGSQGAYRQAVDGALGLLAFRQSVRH